MKNGGRERMREQNVKTKRYYDEILVFPFYFTNEISPSLKYGYQKSQKKGFLFRGKLITVLFLYISSSLFYIVCAGERKKEIFLSLKPTSCVSSSSSRCFLQGKMYRAKLLRRRKVSFHRGLFLLLLLLPNYVVLRAS